MRAPSATGAALPSPTLRPSTSCSTARSRSNRSSRRTRSTTSTAYSRPSTSARSRSARYWSRRTHRSDPMNAPDALPALREFKNHDLVDDIAKPGIRYEPRPAKTADGTIVPGLYNAWITLDNLAQFNSYTTDMVKGVILAFRAASNARDVNSVVFTGAGDKAFCTGGNTKEYAEYYAGHPQEYRQYLRLFNDMVSTILACDKPVICRVNGMRIGGGQEIGMACDFSVAQDLARFGQAGPKHGSAPIGGATDFLPPMIGNERAMVAGVLCEPFSAHKAYHWGIVADIVPALKVDGKFIANPLVETQRFADEYGRIVFGDFKTGEVARDGKALLAKGSVDLSLREALARGQGWDQAFTDSLMPGRRA